MKKIHIFLLLIVVLLSSVLIMYKETYVNSWVVKNNFQNNLKKEMRFLPLDYMGEYEYTACGMIYAKFKSNSKNIEYMIPRFANSFEEFKEARNIDCPDFKYLKPPYKYYEIDDDIIVISGERNSNMEEYVVYNEELCDKEDFEQKVLGDFNSMIITYGQEVYMISQWYKNNQYVIQPLHNSSLICRFNVEE